VIIDDDDDYSLSHQCYHHRHHQLPTAYLQLGAGGKGLQDCSPPMSPNDGLTLTDESPAASGCAYCAVPTAATGLECPGDGCASTGDSDAGDTTCGPCLTHWMDDAVPTVNGQSLCPCRLRWLSTVEKMSMLSIMVSVDRTCGPCLGYADTPSMSTAYVTLDPLSTVASLVECDIIVPTTVRSRQLSPV